MKAFFVLLILAASAIAQEQTPVNAPEAACGPSNVQFAIKTNAGTSAPLHAEDGKALVYVVEDQQFKYVKDVTVRVGLDGAWIGANRGNSYIAFQVDPGEHHLCADWQPAAVSSRLVSLSSVTAEAGKTYYFRARTTGAKAEEVSLDLDLINNDEGRLLVSRTPLSISNPKPKAH
jgi:hypothetical protein